MKKTYINPQLEVIQIKANQTLLAGSLRYDSSTDSYSGDVLEGGYNSQSDEII